MSRARVLAIVVVLVAVYVATPRPAAVIPSAGIPVHGETDQQRTGAPQPVLTIEPEVGATGRFDNGAPTPRPSGGIGEPASYCKPQWCETPQPRIVDGISGTATWWYSFGPGIYTALRPDLGSKGDLVIVCGGAPFHCRTAPVITSCACLGPNSERLVDLSRDLFAEFADPSLGVVRITLQVVGR